VDLTPKYPLPLHYSRYFPPVGHALYFKPANGIMLRMQAQTAARLED